MDVFLPTITVLLLIVGELGLLVGLVLAHVPVVPVVVRQLRAVLRIYRGLVLIKEAACRGREGPRQDGGTEKGTGEDREIQKKFERKGREREEQRGGQRIKEGKMKDEGKKTEMERQMCSKHEGRRGDNEVGW